MQDRCTRPEVSVYAAWHHMVPICTEWWCTEADEATQTHCYNPFAPAYPICAYYVCMDDNADAKRILLASPPADWRRQLGHPRITWLSTVQQDLKQHHLTLPEAADLAQNRPLQRMMSTYGATQSWVACQKRRRLCNLQSVKTTEWCVQNISSCSLWGYHHKDAIWQSNNMIMGNYCTTILSSWVP